MSSVGSVTLSDDVEDDEEDTSCRRSWSKGGEEGGIPRHERIDTTKKDNVVLPKATMEE